MENSISTIKKSKSDIIQFFSTRDIKLLGTKRNSKLISLGTEQVRKDTLRFQKVTPVVWGKLYRTELINKFRFNEASYVLEDVEFLTQIMQKCTITFSDYVGYYYRVTPGSLITQGLDVRKLIGSINCQNSCIHLLENSNMKDRAYSFKYTSLFNWLIRTAKQDDWRDLYRIIQRQILDDKMNILYNEEINFKIKALLCICGIFPLFAHAICKKVNQNN